MVADVLAFLAGFQDFFALSIELAFGLMCVDFIVRLVVGAWRS